MSRNFITKESDCLIINKKEYLSQLSFKSSRIRQDKKIELDMKQEYSGRELYEMIQNADDEGSPKIELVLTEDNHFHIKNWGDNPFTEEGLLSIMRSFLSPKTKESYKNATIRPIGNKGLGFRSLLNWSDMITIHSNGVQCSFSEEIAKREWEMIKDNGLKKGSLTLDDYHQLQFIATLYWYEKNKNPQATLFNDAETTKFIHRDGITDWILKEIRSRFGGSKAIAKEHIYVYWLLHSKQYS